MNQVFNHLLFADDVLFFREALEVEVTTLKALLDALSERTPGNRYLESLRAAFDGPHTASEAAAGSLEPLSYRELETLKLLAWRMTNKEIAAELSVSPSAVKKRLESIYAKLGVKNRRQAVAAAIAAGILDPR